MARANASPPTRQQSRFSADDVPAARDAGPESTGRQLLSVRKAASRLGIRPATLYDWLGQSDHGLLVIRGQPVTIDYLQGGPQGHGRIGIEPAEVERLRELMRVRPRPARRRLPPIRHNIFPGITVPLGRPR